MSIEHLACVAFTAFWGGKHPTPPPDHPDRKRWEDAAAAVEVRVLRELGERASQALFGDGVIVDKVSGETRSPICFDSDERTIEGRLMSDPPTWVTCHNIIIAEDVSRITNRTTMHRVGLTPADQAIDYMSVEWKTGDPSEYYRIKGDFADVKQAILEAITKGNA